MWLRRTGAGDRRMRGCQSFASERTRCKARSGQSPRLTWGSTKRFSPRSRLSTAARSTVLRALVLLFDRPDVLTGENEERFSVGLQELEGGVHVLLGVPACHVDPEALLANLDLAEATVTAVQERIREVLGAALRQ